MTFLACLLGIVLLALVLSRLGGGKARYVESFALEDGERVLWLDQSTDAFPVLASRARLPSYRRMRRSVVLGTNRRIIVGARVFLGQRHLIQHVLYPSDRPFPEDASRAGGGLLTRGHVTLVFERSGAAVMREAGRSFVDLPLSAAAASSANLVAFRIYGAGTATFQLPE